jgi:hypothetical protein
MRGCSLAREEFTNAPSGLVVNKNWYALFIKCCDWQVTFGSPGSDSSDHIRIAPPIQAHSNQTRQRTSQFGPKNNDKDRARSAPGDEQISWLLALLFLIRKWYRKNKP